MLTMGNGQWTMGNVYVPPLWAAIPFAALLLAIAILPLIKSTAVFWHRNRNKLLLSLILAVPVLLYYLLAHPAVAAPGEQAAELAKGWPVLRHMLFGAVVEEYFPFIVLLLSLYTISGGIELRGDLRAAPRTNTAFLAAGAVLASLVGTTGAAMLLIRPLLATNSQRKHVRHTIIFFIFIICNTGGCLLPVGDPPLFLGYLRGVPFLWTLKLFSHWAATNGALLAIYYIWDSAAYRKESPDTLRQDTGGVVPLSLHGKSNLLYLLGVVLAVALLVPGRPLVFLDGVVLRQIYLREIVMLALAAASLATTPKEVHRANHFTLSPMAEVAALFIGIFITMQAPMEILRARGAGLGLTEPWQFFWATGALSSFLDNAPTYVVFFETANSLTQHAGDGILQLLGGQFIREDHLAAVSVGAVFMGAMTYIGNGPNFMVKSIAEHRGVQMPTFFGYMAYSVCVLIPIFVAVTVIFFLMG